MYDHYIHYTKKEEKQEPIDIYPIIQREDRARLMDGQENIKRSE